METLTFDITSAADLARAAETLLERARSLATEQSGAVVLALSGDLGAGKTTFVQTMARLLGVTDTVTSPTFVIMKQYETADTTFAQLIHIDAYRIEVIDEMRPLGFVPLLEQATTLICIEWAERITTLLPTNTITATLTLETDGTRTLTSNS